MSFELPVMYYSEDAELSQLRKREMKKFYEAKMKMKGVGRGGVDGFGGHDYDITDMTDQDVAIVCEELWIDLKRWIGLHKNLCYCGEKVYKSVARNLVILSCIAAFLITFRWYVGAGKDACSYGVGWGAFSLICEVMRYAGEFMLAALIGICGFCCGLLPIIVCVCVYEGVDDDDDDGVGAGVKEKSE